MEESIRYKWVKLVLYDGNHAFLMQLKITNIRSVLIGLSTSSVKHYNKTNNHKTAVKLKWKAHRQSETRTKDNHVAIKFGFQTTSDDDRNLERHSIHAVITNSQVNKGGAFSWTRLEMKHMLWWYTFLENTGRK